MNLRLDRYEYDVLDACIEGMWEVSRGFYQAYPKGMDRRDASCRLAEMIRSDLLFAVRFRRPDQDVPELNGAPDYRGLEVFQPTPGELMESRTAADPRIGVAVTPTGAAAWAAIAHPNWDLYIRNWTREVNVDEECGPWVAHMWSRSRDRLREAIHFGWLGVPIENSEEWTIVSPWRATHWKTFDHGWHVKLLTRGIDSKALHCEAGSEAQARWLQTTNWYRLPWEDERCQWCRPPSEPG